MKSARHTAIRFRRNSLLCRSTHVWATRRLGDRRLGDRVLDDHLSTRVGCLGDSNWPL